VKPKREGKSMSDEDDKPDWQPPELWTREHAERTLKRFVREDSTTYGLQLLEWMEWKKDPEAYRQEQIARIIANRKTARTPTSHAIAHKLLSLPDLPLVFLNDIFNVLAVDAVLEQNGEVMVDGEFVKGPTITLKEHGDD
jgi:hypothetical protein